MFGVWVDFAWLSKDGQNTYSEPAFPFSTWQEAASVAHSWVDIPWAIVLESGELWQTSVGFDEIYGEGLLFLPEMAKS